ncbi:unnamed protein product [Cuscuta campestris]|uniref:Protein kinase domain-containing protein n=1 Tax=Cuscuta campestris TaxID=132261 RepID=A0A484N926_9ASTE|nr:unnamed protein product [Cuscuta campestris]
MRKWLCCNCVVEEPYPSNENEAHKNPWNHVDGLKAPAPAKNEVQKAMPTIEVPKLSLDEIKEKPDNFGSRALIGEGSYGRVYFAKLDNGKTVAVKKLDVSSKQESDVEFLS